MNDTNSGPVQTGNESTQASALGGLQIELRDWFAGMALQGYTGASGVHSAIGHQEINAQEIAGCCYEWADVMLAARKEKP